MGKKYNPNTPPLVVVEGVCDVCGAEDVLPHGDDEADWCDHCEREIRRTRRELDEAVKSRRQEARTKRLEDRIHRRLLGAEPTPARVCRFVGVG